MPSAPSASTTCSALLASEGSDHGREHAIFALFERLSHTTKAAILEAVATPSDEFLRKLSEGQTSSAFVQWRYIHELPDGATANAWTGCLNQLYSAAVRVLEQQLLGH